MLNKNKYVTKSKVNSILNRWKNTVLSWKQKNKVNLNYKLYRSFRMLRNNDEDF